MIKVVNKYKHEETPFDVYIGRGSVLGNPYTSIKNRQTKAMFVCDTREESIEKYEKYLLDKIEKKDKFICRELNRIYTLVKTEGLVNLVCFCHPKPCHGDVIKNIINSKLN